MSVSKKIANASVLLRKEFMLLIFNGWKRPLRKPWHMLRTDGKMDLEEADHEDISMTATAGSCEYGTESVGLVTKGCN
jgi:hypothetical protein